MFSILWRYLLQSYFKIFSLSVCTFISVLIVSRFKDIARFAALSGDWLKTGLFTLYQTPFILPFAIPISTLIGAFLLFQRLSRTYEVAALRTSGASLLFLLTPLLFVSALLSLAHFSMCAIVSPYCFRESKALLYRETSVNPLLLLQRQNLIKIKETYLNMDVKKEGKSAENFLMIAYNGREQRLNLLSAKQLWIFKEKLFGSQLSLLLYLAQPKTCHATRPQLFEKKPQSGFDSLLIENQAQMSTEASILSSVLKRYTPKLETKGLNFKMLRIRASESKEHAAAARAEILGRISLSLSVLSFTLLGSAFGLQQSRAVSKKEVLHAFFLAMTMLTAYLSLKALKPHAALSLSAAFFPHLLIAICSLLRIRRFAKGIL